MLSHLSRFTAPGEIEVGGLRSALDADVSDQHQPQVVRVRGGGGGRGGDGPLV